MKAFNERNQDILNLVENTRLSYQKIGVMFGITRERVRQLVGTNHTRPPKPIKIKFVKTLRDAYEKFVIKQDGCWDWRGSKTKNGYGKLCFHGYTYAHRVSWLLHRGDIPEGMHVLHTCDTPSCSNPEHLFLGTQRDNNLDRDRKGRGKVAVMKV